MWVGAGAHAIGFLWKSDDSLWSGFSPPDHGLQGWNAGSQAGTGSIFTLCVIPPAQQHVTLSMSWYSNVKEF